mgnify:CR=1 FL=1
MADIFQEVDEDLRRDKAAEWWKKYSLYIYATAAVVVIGVAGYQGWRAYDLKLRGERSDAYVLVGGGAFAGDGKLAHDIGADGFALDAGAGSRLLRARFGEQPS